MFFDDESLNENMHRSEALEYKGSFSPHNMDINWTYFDIFFEKTYSKWRFHFFIVFSLLIIISKFYPIIFIIIFLDSIIQVCWQLSDFELITDNQFYDYSAYISQLKGGDSRLNIFVFVYYDQLGYIIYGLSDIGINYCSEIFKYNNYLGLHNKIKGYTVIKKLKNGNSIA